MECNRDEAIRAAELAEKKYVSQDLAGCKKFAIKAMQLFPGLDRAKQMLSVVEVHLAAQHQEDWYGILQVDPASDDATIKKQFRKLALMLHPDKNNVVGAEPAFKLINEAWGVLSDKMKRSTYDLQRSGSKRPPSKSASNGHHGATSRQQHKKHEETDSSDDTFWTQCPSCKIQYQYYRKFENYQLLCHRCKTGFLAKDIGAPPVESTSWARCKDTVQQQPEVHQQQEDPQVGRKTARKKNGVKDDASAANAFQQMQQRAREREEKRREDERRKQEREREREEKRKMKEDMRRAREEEKRKEALERQLLKQREREEREARKKMMEALKKKLKRSRMIEEDDDDDDDDDEDEEATGGEENQPRQMAMGLRRSRRQRRNVIYRDDFDDEDGEGPSGKRLKTEADMVHLSSEELSLRRDLIEMGRQHVLNALRVMGKTVEPESVKLNADPTPQVVENVDVEVPTPEAKRSGTEAVVDVPVEASTQEKSSVHEKDKNCASTDSDEEPSKFFVPDSDFHDFDLERKEEDVQEGQVWALYDSDGMPRYYCEIKQVRSRHPFEVQIRWLELHEERASEQEEKWKEAGFALTSGLFKCARRAKLEKKINMFSHLVRAERIPTNVIGVYPRKGEIWALYRDWCTKWLGNMDQLEKSTKNLKYEMVEVVSDLGEDERGITVMLLFKVPGYKTIFARGNAETTELRKYTGDELLRFSHRVCAHWMTGNEKPNAPKDCWQLDTAATPVHLISSEEDS